jgi:hypothetical protein
MKNVTVMQSSTLTELVDVVVDGIRSERNER